MLHHRVNAAQFIGRVLPDPYETVLGGGNPEATHHLLATAFADLVCPPTGHRTPWHDCYDKAWARPLPHKASFILDKGRPRPRPAYLTGAAARRFLAATRIALRIQQAARSMPLGNQG
ncbi:hypothetical protein [Streptomyces nitrosporeus]|uniref:hypothetical protein n=1 Tax=Streptomyces nitrosporeus TaxID=28894 RepID=UPI0039A20025